VAKKPTRLPPVTLVLGGARSGKSAWAQQRIEDGLGSDWPTATYIATAEAGDAEMAERIARHKAQRDARWSTVETPIGVPRAIMEHTRDGQPVLVDCLTLWLSNMLLSERDVGAMTNALLGTLRTPPGPVVLVSNEVGLGLVPETPLGRSFRDAQGQLNQQVARAADQVVFVAAGLPLTLKENERHL